MAPIAAATFGIVGAGRMGEALMAGLLSSKAFAPKDVVATGPHQEHLDALTARYGVKTSVDNRQAAAADIVLLAVKPHIVGLVLDEIGDSLGDKLVISVAAGVSCDYLEARLPESAHVVRVMPNTPALVGHAMCVVCASDRVDEAAVAQVRDLLDPLGEAMTLPESQLDAASAISGCGPAYFELIIDALARAGVKNGLKREVAQKLAVETMAGTAELIRQTGEHPQALIDQVTSPGGTTIAAIDAMEASGIRTALADGIDAAVQRSKELI